MFRRVFLASLAVLSFAITAPFTAQAQTVFISAGAAIPSGDDSDDINTGWIAAGGLTFDVGEGGLWVGVDGAYGRNSITEDGVDIDENVKPYSLMGILGYSFPTEGSVSPYVWGGAGLAGASVSESTIDVSSGFGWQAGAGISLGSGNARPYVEGRYHSASLEVDSGTGPSDFDLRFFAVLVGVAFGVGN